MKSVSANTRVCRLLGILIPFASVSLAASESLAAEREAVKKAAPAVAVHAPEIFATPEEGAVALIDGGEKFGVGALVKIFGPGGEQVVLSGEFPQDRQRALEFAAKAREKTSVASDPISKSRAFLVVGNGEWPFPVPIVKRASRWQFHAAAGLKELEYRRIGRHELHAIDFCRGYGEAEQEYAFRPREGYDVTQYAQHIVSAPRKHDGLAWPNPDGTWGGPVGEAAARAIEQGYSFEQGKATPYHGYFFKVLKGQGPAAPLGEMDYVVKGVMIGGFALLAVPAEYGETGIKTFIVNQSGVVSQKNVGPETLTALQKMERFNPDRSWTPVLDVD